MVHLQSMCTDVLAAGLPHSLRSWFVSSLKRLMIGSMVDIYIVYQILFSHQLPFFTSIKYVWIGRFILP